VSDKKFAPARRKFHLHSGRTIGGSGFAFNRPSCILCRVFDGRECEYRYCTHCFSGLLGIIGLYGHKRRRSVGAIVRRSRKIYKESE
jgi:hypothetical protein